MLRPRVVGAQCGLRVLRPQLRPQCRVEAALKRGRDSDDHSAGFREGVHQTPMRREPPGSQGRPLLITLFITDALPLLITDANRDKQRQRAEERRAEERRGQWTEPHKAHGEHGELLFAGEHGIARGLAIQQASFLLSLCLGEGEGPKQIEGEGTLNPKPSTGPPPSLLTQTAKRRTGCWSGTLRLTRVLQVRGVRAAGAGP